MVVNRVLRDDSDKSPMHNREPITPKLLWQSLQDYQWSLVLAPPGQLPLHTGELCL